MAGQLFHEVLAQDLFARCHQQHEGAVGLRVLLAFDEIGQGEETSMTLVAIVGNNARSQTGLDDIALELAGNRLAVGAVKDGELCYGAEVGRGSGVVGTAVGVVVVRLGRQGQLAREIVLAREYLI